MSECDGDGQCLVQKTMYTYQKNNQIICNHNCKPVKCPKCKKKFPQWILDTNSGFCMSCGKEVFAAFGNLENELKLKHVNIHSDQYNIFATLIAELCD